MKFLPSATIYDWVSSLYHEEIVVGIYQWVAVSDPTNGIGTAVHSCWKTVVSYCTQCLYRGWSMQLIVNHTI